LDKEYGYLRSSAGNPLKQKFDFGMMTFQKKKRTLLSSRHKRGVSGSMGDLDLNQSHRDPENTENVNRFANLRDQDKKIKNPEQIFKKLDLYNLSPQKKIEQILLDKFKDFEIYREFNNHLVTSNFSINKNTKQSHYMTPFRMFAERLGPSDLGAAIWGTKILFNEFLDFFSKNSNYVNFMGFFSLILNLGEYLHKLDEIFLDDYKEFFMDLEELIFVKEFYLYFLTEELKIYKGKISKISVETTGAKISMGFVMDKKNSNKLKMMMKTKMKEFGVPNGFDFVNFVTYCRFFELVN
jgi:hypothetical protein